MLLKSIVLENGLSLGIIAIVMITLSILQKVTTFRTQKWRCLQVDVSFFLTSEWPAQKAVAQ